MKRIIALMFTFFTTLFMVINGVDAAESVDSSLNASHKDIKGGEEVEITLKFDGFNDIKKGINAYKATLEYDEAVFEKVFQDSFVCLNGWEELLYNPNTKELVSINRVGTTTGEAVAKVKLKVRSGMQASKTSVRFKDVVVSEGKKDIEVKPATTILNVVTEQSSVPSGNGAHISLNKPSGTKNVLGTTARSNLVLDKVLKVADDIVVLEEQENINDESIEGAIIDSSKHIKEKDKKDVFKKIKKTSNNYFCLFILLLIEVLAVVIFLYLCKKRKNSRNDIGFSNNQKKFMSFFIIGILSFEFIGTVFAAASDFSGKGELNGDSEINYADVNLLELHLIDLKSIDDHYIENADMNSDGKITVTDLTLLIQKLEKTLDYEVTLSNLRFDNYYPNKNEDAKLRFNASVSFGAFIEKIVVNEKELDVNKKDNSDEYGTMFNVRDTAGVKEYKITKMILSNGKIIPVDYSIKLDVLKTKPNISNYNVVEDDSDAAKLKANVSFNFNDKDNSMTNGEITVINDKGEIVKSGKVKNGKNTLSVLVENGKSYKLKVSVKYDLDTNELKQEKDNAGELSFEKNLRVVVDYNFTIGDIKAFKDHVEITQIEKNEPIHIHFNSTNNSDYEPAEVTVNGKGYQVVKEGNVYTANTISFDKLGDSAITIESVTLANGKKFEVKKDNKVNIKVIKRKPVTKELTYTENISDNKLNVKFDLIDEDNSIKRAKVVLYDDKDTEISSKDLTLDEIKSGNVEKSLDTVITSKYKIKVMATYNQDTDDIEATLLEKEVNALPNAKITSVSSDKKYLEKKGVVVLTYTINSNKTNDVSKIRVNNVDCIAEEIEDGKYKVSYEIGEESGITELTATKLIFNDNSMADASKTIKVEVLKDKPKINNFNLEDDLENEEVDLSFDVKDVEDTFVSGKAVLTNTEDGTSVSKEISKGLNKLTFKVKNSVKYNLDIKITYDRDTNTLEGTENNENLVLNEIILSKNIWQLSDYEVKINNLKTYNKENETKYFEKNTPITVSFGSTNLTDFVPVSAVINGKSYELTKNNGIYETITDSYDAFGVKDIIIEEVTFDNSKRVKLEDNNSVKIEILKDEPKVKDFNYKENTDNTVTTTFNLEDNDKTLKSSKVVITDENNKEIKSVNVKAGENEISFNLGESEVYSVNIIADYDLDTNAIDKNSNEFTNKVIDTKIINIGARLIEMKDIVSFNVYKQTEDGVAAVEKLKPEDLSNLDDYIVKVQSKKMPTFYTKIKEYNVENNKLKLTLDYDDVVQYNENTRQNKLEVVYGNIDNGEATNISLESLAQKIESNPGGTFTLTRDYDASLLSNSSSSFLLAATFSGTLNGNGHKIYNLAKPLFGSLEAGTVKNLTLENVSLPSTSNAPIANTATNAIISNVHIKDLTFNTGLDSSGGIIGEGTSTNIENSSVSDLNLTTNRIRIGGIAGRLTGGTIKNCYVSGNISATSTKDGNGIGGILGAAEADPVTTIENCLTKIKFENASGPRLNGAIIGLAMNGKAILKNNVSLSTGEKIYSVHGYTIDASSTNNYELEDSGLTTNASGDKVKTIDKKDINKAFFKNNVKFDETIWNLDEASYDNIPTLKGSSTKEETKVETPKNRNLYIPDYSRIKKIHGFSESKEILYHNINKLMPYYDAKYLVEDGNKIKNDDVLNTKIIKHIIPYNTDGKMMTYLTNENHNSIAKIKVIFTDYTVNEYKVKFKELKQNISIYEINDLPLEYAYDNYVIKEDAAIVKTLTDYINNTDYTKVLDPLTTAADSRLYRDHYNVDMKAISKTIALQLLQNEGNSIPTIDNDILNNKIKHELIDSGKLNKILYAYNYYHRWYNFEIGGSKVSDIILFEGKMYTDSMNLDNLTNEVLNGNLATNATTTFYANSLRKYTGSSTLPYFLDYIIENIGGYEDINDWFTEHFSKIGILSEIPVDGHPEVKYRAWDRIKGFPNFILPLATLPKDAGYIISGPAQFQIGSQRTYVYDPTTVTGQNSMKNIVKNHSNLVRRQFNTLAGSFHVESWNNFTILVYDTVKTIIGYKTSYLPGTNIPIGTSPVTTMNRAGTTNDPFCKNFNEAVGAWQYGSAGGVGSTAGFLWFIATPGLTNYDTWTHEFQHALADKIMLFRSGMRMKMEIYTQGNVEQRESWSINNIQGYDVGPYYFNLAYTLNKEGNATQNLTPERINTREKLENYYKGQLDALELLDYVSAKAFIKLTPEQQSKIATRMAQSGGWSSWGTITASQAEEMKLTTLESLWDNHIILRPNNAWGVSIRGLTPINGVGVDDYGYESIWVTRWYMGHNDGGYADAFSNKKNLFEMLGYGGVNGYVTFGSRRSSSDLDAIQKITKAKTGKAMNWKEYRMSRYAEIESKLNNKYVDIDFMIDEFTKALTNDANNGNRNITSATNLRKLYYHYLKSVTNDFVADPLGTNIEMTHIKTASELVTKINAKPYGYYILDNDIDFSGMTTNITNTFMGTFDGNGHKITGNTKPIFQKIRYGSVKNLIIEETNIPKNIAGVGALSVRTESSVLANIEGKDINLNVGNRNELSLIGGAVSNVTYKDIKVETHKNIISSIDDISKFVDDPSGVFVIENDIDFTGYTGNGTVVPGTFMGKIDGKGHTFKNLNGLSLFNQFNGIVLNLNIKNFTNVKPQSSNNGDEVAAFAKYSNGAIFKDMKFENITLEGRHRVAPVVTFDNLNSTFENISVVNANVKGSGVYVSTFIGRKYGGIIKDVYVQGTLECTTTENGGIIGALQKGGTITNTISNVSVIKPSNTDSLNRQLNGGFIGNIYTDGSSVPNIKNSISIGSMTGYTDEAGEKNPYKFTGASEEIIVASLVNCYEYTIAAGMSSITGNTGNNLKGATSANIHDVNFYRETLAFDEKVWNFDSVVSTGHPTLK